MINIKNKEKINGKLEPATIQQFDLLQKQIETDPETRRMLTSPMGEIPQYYWLYSDVTTYAAYYSLFGILRFFIPKDRGGTKLLFSKTCKEFFVGFVLYIDNGNVIEYVKTASFFDDRKKENPQLVYDLMVNFIESELSRKERIEWVANKNNKQANNQYVKLLRKNKYKWTRVEDKKHKYLWVYSVTGRR